MSGGGIIGSVAGVLGIGGGGGGGGGASGGDDGWHQKTMNPGSWGGIQLGIETRHLTWMSILAGLVGTYSLIRDYQLRKRMVDLHERSVDQAEEYLELAKRHYNEIALPAFNRTRDHFDYVRNNYRPFIDLYLREAKRWLVYTPDYDTAMGRTISVVQTQLDRARKQRSRMRGKFEIGRSCHEDLIFSIRGAELRASAADRGFRYEDAKKQKMDEFYWNRLSAGAEVAASAMANAISGLNQSSAMVSTALGRVGDATQGIARATSLLTGAMGEQSDFYNGLGNVGFGAMRQNMRRTELSTKVGADSMVSTSNISSIANGARSGFGGLSTITGSVGSQRPTARPSHLNTTGPAV